MRKYLLFLILIPIITGCGIKPKARGDLNTVIIFADSAVYARCEPALQNALGKIVDTPQPEPVFNLKPVSFDKFSDSTVAATIIMLCSLEDEGPVSQYVQGMFDSTALKGIKDGVFWFFAKENPWYRNQQLIIAAANDAGELAFRLVTGGEEIFGVMNKALMQRSESEMYEAGEKIDLEKEIRSKYGFSVRIQHDYFLVTENADERYIRLRRANPERWMTISWMQADSLSEQMVVDERIRLGKLFGDPSRIEPDYNKLTACDDIVPGGILLRGLYVFEIPTGGGGPFFTYAIRDSAQRKVYFIDGMVFAPGKEKMPFLTQLEVMARTFGN